MTTREKIFALATAVFVASSASVACGSSTDTASESEALSTDHPTSMSAPFGGANSFGSGTSSPAGESAVTPSAQVPPPMPYRGINLAGAEFGDAVPGVEGTDYAWPTTASIDYYLSKGMNTFRIGFKWERLQPTANGEFVATYAAKLDELVTYVTAKGGKVVLNPHNFARYYGKTVGSPTAPNAAFADLWRRLATKYAGNASVLFNLVNEPHDLPTEQWVSAANDAIAAIRSANAPNGIIVPGNAWTGAHSWNNDDYGTPNAVAMLDIVDPIDNIAFEAHQYLDPAAGGKSGECVSPTAGSARLKPWVDWLRANKKKGFVGEFAGGENPTCVAAIEDMARYMMDNSDVIVGWLWWAGGPRWRADYPFDLEPKNGVENPYMARLAAHLSPLTAKAHVTTQSGNTYCADVAAYDWSGLRPLEWSTVAVDLRDGVSFSVDGGALSATTGAATATPTATNKAVPLGGRAKVTVCATTGPSGATISASAAK